MKIEESGNDMAPVQVTRGPENTLLCFGDQKYISPELIVKIIV
ncbi:MAG: hypothetical protein ABSH06_08555 [Thermodesulfobacteriota bacterium]